MEIENERENFKISKQQGAALIAFMKDHPNLVSGKFTIISLPLQLKICGMNARPI